MSSETVTVHLVQRLDYQFEVSFGDGVAPLLVDEPPPLGRRAGPSPAELLASAVGSCLAASLLFSLQKYKQQVDPVRSEVSAEVGRNDEGRLRVLAMQATLTLGVPRDGLQHLDRALSQFETYCTVTQSIAAAVPVTVRVFDAQGEQLK